jgi:uncharacterized membrane protein YiaA
MGLERPMAPIRFVLRHPTLRLIAVALLLLGAHNASIYPYQSVIVIERIGMSFGDRRHLLGLVRRFG